MRSAWQAAAIKRKADIARLEARARWCQAAADRVWQSSGYTNERGMGWYAIRAGAFEDAAAMLGGKPGRTRAGRRARRKVL